MKRWVNVEQQQDVRHLMVCNNREQGYCSKNCQLPSWRVFSTREGCMLLMKHMDIILCLNVIYNYIYNHI